MRFSLVFLEACNAASPEMGRLPEHVDRLMLMREDAQYINLLWADILKGRREGERLSDAMLRNLRRRYSGGSAGWHGNRGRVPHAGPCNKGRNSSWLQWSIGRSHLADGLSCSPLAIPRLVGHPNPKTFQASKGHQKGIPCVLRNVRLRYGRFWPSPPGTAKL